MMSLSHNKQVIVRMEEGDVVAYESSTMRTKVTQMEHRSQDPNNVEWVPQLKFGEKKQRIFHYIMVVRNLIFLHHFIPICLG